MKKNYSLFKSISILTMFFLIVAAQSGNASSMYDDPRFDRIPQIYLDQVAQYGELVR